MKLLVFAFVVVAWAQASQVKRDLKPVRIEPIFMPSSRRLARPGGRITGGYEVEPNSLPYQVGLFINTADGTNFCGGSVLSANTVVTAAHCGELSDDIDIVFGAHKIRETDEATQLIVKASKVIVHPEWDRLLLQNDISIIWFDQEIQLNANIQPVRLPKRADVGKDYLDVTAKASGWGLPNDGATTISEVLRAIDVPIGSNSGCNIYYLGVIQNSHICAAGDGGKSTCSGDSGGPLVAETGELIGITSFGISFGCEIGWPSVYTRVTEFLDWIEENGNVTIE